MDLYTMDNSSPFNARDIVQGFTSLVWTERYSSYGDFELTTPNIDATLAVLQPGMFVSVTGSNYLMRCETIKIEEDDDGSDILTVNGRSLETVLETRAAPIFTFSGTPPGLAVLTILQSAIQYPYIDSGDVLPDFDILNGVTEAAGTEIAVSVEIGDTYSAVSGILSAAGYGLTAVRDVDDSTGVVSILLIIYQGNDHSIDQDITNQVIFHVANGDITGASYLYTTQGIANVAYVYGPSGQVREVFTPNPLSTMRGLDRVVVPVDASDIEDTTQDADGNDIPIDPSIVNATMDQRGWAALAAQTKPFTFDGQINPISTAYKIPDDYYLGDLVTLFGRYGFSQTMRVEEIIRTRDGDGERIYPTLVAI